MINKSRHLLKNIFILFLWLNYLRVLLVCFTDPFLSARNNFYVFVLLPHKSPFVGYYYFLILIFFISFFYINVDDDNSKKSLLIALLFLYRIWKYLMNKQRKFLISFIISNKELAHKHNFSSQIIYVILSSINEPFSFLCWMCHLALFLKRK